MADANSTNHGVLKMEDGSHQNEWGELLNINIDRWDAMAQGYLTIALSGAKTLDANSITSTSSTGAENSYYTFLEFTGTAGTVTAPANDRMWIVYNNSDGAFTFKPAGGTGVTTNQGKVHFIVYGSSGTTFVDISQLIDFDLTPSFTTVTTTGDLTVGGDAVMSTGQGIDFSANTNAAGMTSEILDDYEEGTFTPTIVGTTVAGAGTYTTQVGTYTKIGRLVNFQIYLNWSAHTGTGDMNIGGLPVTSANTADVIHPVSFYHTTLTLSTSNILLGFININSTSITLRETPTGTSLAAAVAIDTAALVMASGSYIT